MQIVDSLVHEYIIESSEELFYLLEEYAVWDDKKEYYVIDPYGVDLMKSFLNRVPIELRYPIFEEFVSIAADADMQFNHEQLKETTH